MEGLMAVRASARQYRIENNNSFRWRHCFLAVPASTKSNHLQVIIEAEEIFSCSFPAKASAI